MAHGHGFDTRHHALMAVGTAHLLQTFVVAVDQPGADLLGPFNELAHALIAAGGVDVDFDH